MRDRISGRGVAAADELTKAERQVAELAAEGRKNREIAAAMFITVGTVARVPQARRPLAGGAGGPLLPGHRP